MTKRVNWKKEYTKIAVRKVSDEEISNNEIYKLHDELDTKMKYTDAVKLIIAAYEEGRRKR